MFISALVFVMVKRCINAFWHYFPYGVNVEYECSVKFVVTHPSVVSFAAVFRVVTQRSPGGALRDIPKDGCEGD